MTFSKVGLLVLFFLFVTGTVVPAVALDYWQQNSDGSTQLIRSTAPATKRSVTSSGNKTTPGNANSNDSQKQQDPVKRAAAQSLQDSINRNSAEHTRLVIEQTGKFENGVGECKDLSRQMGEPLVPTDACKQLDACENLVDCGDLTNRLDTCATTIQDQDSDGLITETKATSDDETESVKSTTSGETNPKMPYVHFCLNSMSKEIPEKPSDSDSLAAAAQKSIYGAVKSKTSSSSDLAKIEKTKKQFGVCKTLQGSQLAQYLSDLGKSAKEAFTNSKKIADEADNKKDDMVKTCDDKKLSLITSITKINSEIQTTSAKMRVDLINADKPVDDELTALWQASSQAQAVLTNLQTTAQQKTYADYYDAVEKIRNGCYADADKKLEKHQAFQAQQQQTSSNMAGSLSSALSNAASGGNNGQNATYWQNAVNYCLNRQANAFASLNNQFLVARQELVNQIAQATSKVTTAMNAYNAALKSSPSKKAAVRAEQNAQLTALNNEVQNLQGQLNAIKAGTISCGATLKSYEQKASAAQEQFRVDKINAKNLGPFATVGSGATASSSTNSLSDSRTKIRDANAARRILKDMDKNPCVPTPDSNAGSGSVKAGDKAKENQ